MTKENHICNVAIVGATGRSGGFIAQALLQSGKYTVTAVTRGDGQSKMPKGLITKKVDYDKTETLVEALKGQDALVITLGRDASEEIDLKLIKAAGEANVPWILPNEWGIDTDSEQLIKDIPLMQSKSRIRNAIAELGKSSYIAVSTGFWYEWSLAIPPAFGFNLADRAVTFFDDGKTKISISTWPQVGKVVASLLSLPIIADNGEACLETLKNKVVYVNSFTVNQRDMFESVLRVTGTKEEEWNIKHQPVKDRFQSSFEEIQKGDHMNGFAKMLYSRIFYPDGCGNTEQNKGTINHLLDLPSEDFDEATGRAIERSKLPNWFA